MEHYHEIETPEQGIDRRTLLSGVTAAIVPLAAGSLAHGQAAQGGPENRRPFPGLTMRTHQPDNLEFPFQTLDSFIIPTDRFYVRSHFPVPNINIKTWRLRVEGEVERPMDLTIENVRTLPS